MTMTRKGKKKSNDSVPVHPSAVEAPKHSCCGQYLLKKAQGCLSNLWPVSAAPKERILATACDLFYREGIHAVGVETIAKAADTNKMTLYRHFRSKDELIAAYLEQLAEEGMKKWDATAAEYSDDPKGQLLAWISLKGPCNSSNFSRGCAFINAAAELPDKNHPGRIIIEKYKRMYRDMILDLCRKAKLTDPEDLADELHLVFEGAVVSAQNLGAEGPASRFVRLSKLIIEAHSPQ